MKEEIESMVEEVAREQGLFLVALGATSGMGSGGGALRITVGRKGSEVPTSTEDCARLSKAVSDRLDAEGLSDFFVGRFTLEVSSPGLTRKLKTDRELEYALGAKVTVGMRGSDNGGPFAGTLKSFDENEIVLEVQGEETESGELNLQRSTIRTVRLDLL